MRSQDIDIFIMMCEVERTLSFICPPAILRAGFADQVATQHEAPRTASLVLLELRGTMHSPGDFAFPSVASPDGTN